ncbi:hypothetical protein BKA80DRAFT_254058 [Phyllosticta citrichinensis]
MERIIDNRILRICRGHLQGLRVGIDPTAKTHYRMLLVMNWTMRLIFWATVTWLLKTSFGPTILTSQAFENFQLSATFPRMFKEEAVSDPDAQQRDQSALLRHCRKCSAMSLENLRHNRLRCSLSLIWSTTPDLGYKPHVLETAVSKGTFQNLEGPVYIEVHREQSTEEVCPGAQLADN